MLRQVFETKMLVDTNSYGERNRPNVILGSEAAGVSKFKNESDHDEVYPSYGQANLGLDGYAQKLDKYS